MDDADVVDVAVGVAVVAVDVDVADAAAAAVVVVAVALAAGEREGQGWNGHVGGERFALAAVDWIGPVLAAVVASITAAAAAAAAVLHGWQCSRGRTQALRRWTALRVWLAWCLPLRFCNCHAQHRTPHLGAGPTSGWRMFSSPARQTQ